MREPVRSHGAALREQCWQVTEHYDSDVGIFDSTGAIWHTKTRHFQVEVDEVI